MIVEYETGTPAPTGRTETFVAAAVAAAVLALAGVVLLLRAVFAPGAALPANALHELVTQADAARAKGDVVAFGPAGVCSDPSRGPAETVSRMFELMGSGYHHVAACWTEGQAALVELAAYDRAGRPARFSILSVSSGTLRGSENRSGQLGAAVLVTATWYHATPPGWADGERRWVILRQQPGGGWTIDDVEPQTR